MKAKIWSVQFLTGALFALTLLAAPSFAQNYQKAKVEIALPKVAEKAAEVVDVSLENNLLSLAGKFLSDKDPDEAEVKKMISKLKGVYVKSFEFEKEGAYDEADIEGIRTQLRAPGWARIVGVTSKRERGNAEIYVMTEGELILGLTVISLEPKELTVVNIIGPVDIDQLARLEGKFGVPKIGVDHTPKEPSKKEKKQ